MKPWFACNGFALRATYPHVVEEPALDDERPWAGARRGIEAASRNLERCRRAGLTPDEEA